MKLWRLALVCSLGGLNCHGSGRDSDRDELRQRERFCKLTLKELRKAKLDSKGLDQRRAGVLASAVAYCVKEKDQSGAKQAMRDLKAASPTCYRAPFEDEAQQRALVRVLTYTERGVQVRPSAAELRGRKRDLCRHTVAELERAARAAETSSRANPDRITGPAVDALTQAVYFCARERDIERASQHLAELQASVNLCAPPLGSTLPPKVSGANIDRERQSLSALAALMRRAWKTPQR